MFKQFLFIMAVIAVPYSHSAQLPIGSSTKRFYDFSDILDKTWQGMYRRNVSEYDIKCIHRPNSELPGDCVSEGIGYGMILALYSNDQKAFNEIWDAGEVEMWSGTEYNWRINENGSTIGYGAATDAEIDIATMLIFADRLVEKGTWTAFTSTKGASYANRAQTILNNLYSSGIDKGILLPGYGWGAGSFWNPAYFSPAFFKVFAEFDSNLSHDWNNVIDKCYQSIANNPGYALGLVPDWAKHDGTLTPAGPGYNAFLNGDSFYKDAIRILWRIATDYAWYQDDRAKSLLENAIKFIKSADRANFYNIDGSLYDDSITFVLGNDVERPRKEHSHLTVGQWLTTITVAQDSAYIYDFLKKMHSFYEPGADYWGISEDPINSEDTLHNEMYFDQFLAWFGASLVSGKFQNVYEDIALPEGYVIEDQRFVNLDFTTQIKVVELDISQAEYFDLYTLSGKSLGRYLIHDEKNELQISAQGIYFKVYFDSNGKLIGKSNFFVR